jgi:bacterioferritin-associated ferredoxin
VIVCHCRVVTDREVAEAVQSGAHSLARVCRSTGAGQDCGACVFSLRRLVCEHGAPRLLAQALTPSRSVLSEVDVAAG